MQNSRHSTEWEQLEDDGNFKTSCKITVKTSVVLVKEQINTWWNRVERPEIHPESPLVFDKEAKSIPWRKDSIFNKCWNAGTKCKKKILDTDLAPFTKTNSSHRPGINLYKTYIRKKTGMKISKELLKCNIKETAQFFFLFFFFLSFILLVGG